MKLLAFDTSTPHATLALGLDGKVLADVAVRLGNAHSQRLLTMVEWMFVQVGWSFGDLDGIVVGIGPGLFTGLRVGVATAQGLAYAHGCPLYAVNSLDAHALTAPNGPRLVAVCKDARKRELYTGVYHFDGKGERPERLAPTRLLAPEVLAKELAGYDEPVTLLGNGAALYRDSFAAELGSRWVELGSDSFHVVRASSLLRWAEWEPNAVPAQEVWRVEPVYIRPSEAEMKIGPPEGGPPLQGRVRPDGSILEASDSAEGSS